MTRAKALCLNMIVKNEMANLERCLTEATPVIAAEQFGGGTPGDRFRCGFLTLVHEVSERDKQRYYRHGFAWFDSDNRLRRLKLPFFFMTKEVGFAAALAGVSDGKGLPISFGVADHESRIATVQAGEVCRLLLDVEHSPSGPPENGDGIAKATFRLQSSSEPMGDLRERPTDAHDRTPRQSEAGNGNLRPVLRNAAVAALDPSEPNDV